MSAETPEARWRRWATQGTDPMVELEELAEAVTNSLRFATAGGGLTQGRAHEIGERAAALVERTRDLVVDADPEALAIQRFKSMARSADRLETLAKKLLTQQGRQGTEFSGLAQSELSKVANLAASIGGSARQVREDRERAVRDAERAAPEPEREEAATGSRTR